MKKLYTIFKPESKSQVNAQWMHHCREIHDPIPIKANLVDLSDIVTDIWLRLWLLAFGIWFSSFFTFDLFFSGRCLARGLTPKILTPSLGSRQPGLSRPPSPVLRRIVAPQTARPCWWLSIHLQRHRTRCFSHQWVPVNYCCSKS